MSLYSEASIIIPPEPSVKAGGLSAIDVQNRGLSEFTVTRALDTATRINEEGLIELVAANVPRIDFLDGINNASLLVEPTRTNRITNSQTFITTWSGANRTLTQNFGISPDGTTNSVKYTKNTGPNTVATITQSSVFNTTGNHAFSIFIRNINSPTLILRADSSGNTANLNFNTTTNTITESGANLISSSSKVENYGNGWYRISGVANVTSTSWIFDVGTFQDGIGSEFEVWGAQVEVGNYVTSYIPTSGSTVTRNRDEISLSNVSQLLGQIEGALFIDYSLFDVTNSPSTFFTLTDTNGPDYVLFGPNTSDKNRGLVVNDSTINVNITGTIIFDSNIYYRSLFNYKSGDSSIYMDGVVDKTDTSTFTPLSTVNKLNFDQGLNIIYGRIKSLLVYKTALDTEASEALTSYFTFEEIVSNKNYEIL